MKETLKVSSGLEAIKAAHHRHKLTPLFWPVGQADHERLDEFGQEILNDPNVTKEDLVEYITREVWVLSNPELGR